MAGSSVKVEPKTFFANERTLLSWMNIAVLLSTLSLTLLNFGVATSRVAGLILAPISIFFIVYAFYVYVKRNNSLLRKEPIQYNDMLGPCILVIVLVVALTLIVVLNVAYGGKLSVHPVEKNDKAIGKNESIFLTSSLPYRIHESQGFAGMGAQAEENTGGTEAGGGASEKEIPSPAFLEAASKGNDLKEKEKEKEKEDGVDENQKISLSAARARAAAATAAYSSGQSDGQSAPSPAGPATVPKVQPSSRDTPEFVA